MSSEFYNPYAKKLWGIPADEIDSELARRRVSATSPFSILQRLLKSSTPSGRIFLYPKNGYGQIVKCLTEAAVSAGVDIKLEQEVFDLIFNTKDDKKVNRDATKGIVKGSAVNFYDPDITEKDVDNFYSNKKVPNADKPISLGLNSKLIKENGIIKEKIWRKGGMYSASIEKIIENLELA